MPVHVNNHRFPEGWGYSEFRGVKLIPVHDRRLERVSISGIKIPHYKGQSLFLLARNVKYHGFTHNLQFANPDRVLDRPTAEAAWMKLVTRYYQRWDPRPEAASDRDFKTRVADTDKSAFIYKMEMLDEAKNQLRGDVVDQYWQTKAEKNPGLDIRSALNPMTDVERIEYGVWKLSREPLPHEEMGEDEELSELEEMVLKLGTSEAVADEDRMEM